MFTEHIFTCKQRGITIVTILSTVTDTARIFLTLVLSTVNVVKKLNIRDGQKTDLTDMDQSVFNKNKKIKKQLHLYNPSLHAEK